MNAKTVLAIDPGSSKLGMAVVHRGDKGQIELLWRAIQPREELLEGFKTASKHHRIEMVIVGSGTQSRSVVAEIREAAPSIGILVIDEKDTTMQARERYWEANERKGWRKLLPSTLQVPPDPVDDFVAMILAERVLLQS